MATQQGSRGREPNLGLAIEDLKAMVPTPAGRRACLPHLGHLIHHWTCLKGDTVPPGSPVLRHRQGGKLGHRDRVTVGLYWMRQAGGVAHCRQSTEHGTV